MATHRFVATTWHNVLGTLPAELRIESGDTVVTDTIDAHGKDRDNVRRANSPNPMNGPIHVAGAEPGRCAPGRHPQDEADPRHRLDRLDARRERRRSAVRRRAAAAENRDLADRPQGKDRAPRPQHRGPRPPRPAACPDDRLLRRRARPAVRRSRPRPAPRTAATWTTGCSAPGRASAFRCPRRARCSSSATATPSRATARSSAPASRPPSR